MENKMHNKALQWTHTRRGIFKFIVAQLSQPSLSMAGQCAPELER